MFGHWQSVSPDHGALQANSAAYAKFVTANHAATMATPTPEINFQVRIDNLLARSSKKTLAHSTQSCSPNGTWASITAQTSLRSAPSPLANVVANVATPLSVTQNADTTLETPSRTPCSPLQHLPPPPRSPRQLTQTLQQLSGRPRSLQQALFRRSVPAQLPKQSLFQYSRQERLERGILRRFPRPP